MDKYNELIERFTDITELTPDKFDEEYYKLIKDIIKEGKECFTNCLMKFAFIAGYANNFERKDIYKIFENKWDLVMIVRNIIVNPETIRELVSKCENKEKPAEMIEIDRITDILKSKKNINYKKIAKKYHKYMIFRAKKENIGYGLTEKFYEKHLKMGYAFFFGVYYDGNDLTLDIQNKDAFTEWKNRGIQVKN